MSSSEIRITLEEIAAIDAVFGHVTESLERPDAAKLDRALSIVDEVICRGMGLLGDDGKSLRDVELVSRWDNE